MSKFPAKTPLDFDAFCQRLQNLEREAFDGGLFLTGHAINAAVRRAGFEYADLLDRKRTEAYERHEAERSASK